MTLIKSIAMVLAVAAIGLVPADAHTALVGSTPAQGAVLAQSPDVITLTFNEEAIPVSVRLYDAAGNELQSLGAPEEDGKSVTAALMTPLQSGAYKIVYRVASGDSHAVEGEIGFSIDAKN